MVTLSLLAMTALASEQTFHRGDFLLQRKAIGVDVLRAVVPDAPPEPVAAEQDRICRVSLAWKGEVKASALGCPAALADRAEAAVNQWSLLLSPTPPDEIDLLVVWFRFPGVDAPTEPVTLAVSGVPGTEIVALPSGVAAAIPAKVTAREAVDWPEGVATDASAVCDVRLAVSEEGSPFNLAVDGCDGKWLPVVREALLGWKFAPAQLAGGPVRVNVPLRVRFAGGKAAIEQMSAADSDTRYIALDPDTKDEEQVDNRPPPPPLPDHGPVLVLHDPNLAPVEVYTLGLPPPGPPGARCRIVAQVLSDRRTWVWAVDPCDPAVKDAALTAAQQWLLKPADKRAPNEVYARFAVDLLYGADGAPKLVVDARSVVDSPDRPLPTEVGTFVAPEPLKQPPPKRVEGAKGECGLAVQLDAKGKPTKVSPAQCPTELASSAVHAVRRWRWTPPTIDGEHVPTQIDVVVRFR